MYVLENKSDTILKMCKEAVV